MSDSLSISMENQIDSTLNQGVLSYEWLQLLLFSLLAFLGWFLCSRAFNRLSQRFKPSKGIEFSKVNTSDSFGKKVADYAKEHSVKATMKNFGLTRAEVQKYAKNDVIQVVDVHGQDEPLQPLQHKEVLETEEMQDKEDDFINTEGANEPGETSKKKKKQRAKKAQKAAAEAEEVAAVEETAAVEEVPEKKEDTLYTEQREGWTTKASKRTKDDEGNLSRCQQMKIVLEKAKAEETKNSTEGKLDWFEASKDGDDTFFKITKDKRTSKPTVFENVTIEDAQKRQEAESNEKGKSTGKGLKPAQEVESNEKGKSTGKGLKPAQEVESKEKGKYSGKVVLKPAQDVESNEKGKSSGKGGLKPAKDIESNEKGKSSGKGGQKPAKEEESTEKGKSSGKVVLKPAQDVDSSKGKSEGKGMKWTKKAEENAKPTSGPVTAPTAAAPPVAAAWEGLTWAERIRLANPPSEEEKEEPATPAPKEIPMSQEEFEKTESVQRKRKQRKQQDAPEKKPVVVPPRAITAYSESQKTSGAPGWQWNMSDASPEDSSRAVVQQCPPPVFTPPLKIPGVAPGWTWDETEEFPHPDVHTGSMPLVVQPRKQQNRSLMLGMVVNWGSKGFGFLGDQMGNRYYAKQEIVRGGGKLRIGSFVWFRLYDNNDARVAEVAHLEEHHLWAVKKAIAEGTAWCRLRCEIDGDMTILSEEEAGFPGKFHSQVERSPDLNWDVDLIQVANEAKAAVQEEPDWVENAVPAWLDSAYMTSAAPKYIEATPLHGAADNFWTHYEGNYEPEPEMEFSNDQWTMMPLNSAMPYAETHEEYQHIQESEPALEAYQQMQDFKPNLDAFSDDEDDE